MVKSNCEYCGLEKDYIYKSAIKRFCSHRCSSKWKWENLREKAEEQTIVCQCCNKVFTKQLSFLRVHPDTKFCSKKCSSNASRTRKVVSCKTCEKEFETTRNIYCSRDCAIEGRKKEYKKWEDKEFVSKYNKQYNNENREKINLIKREYNKTEKGNSIKTLLRIKRRKSGNLCAKDIIEIKQKSKNKCYWCGIKVEEYNINFDHYIPIALGGLSNKENIVLSCKKCNQSKGSKHPIKYANEIGKLL